MTSTLPGPARGRALLRSGPVRRFLLTKAISSLANGVGIVALPIFLLMDHGAARMGYYLSVVTLSSLVALPAAGQLADRLPRGRLIRGGYVLSAAAPLVLLLGGSDLAATLGAAGLSGIGAAAGSPATRAGLADLAGTDRLAAAQGLLSVLQNVIAMVTPALGGLAVALWSAGALLWTQALAFGLAALCTPAIPRPVVPAGVDPGPAAPVGALRAVAGVRWIRAGLVQTMLQILLGFAPGLVLIRVVASDRYGSEGLGLILAVSAASALVGTMLAAWWRTPLPGLWANVGFLAYAPVFGCLAWAVPFPAFLAAIAVGGVGISLHGVWWYVAINQAFRADLRGRVNALDTLATKLLEPAGMALTVPVVSAVGLPLVAGAGALVFLLAPILTLMVPGFARYSEPAREDRGAVPADRP